MFTDKGKRRQAVTFCSRCPVVDACLVDALKLQARLRDSAGQPGLEQLGVLERQFRGLWAGVWFEAGHDPVVFELDRPPRDPSPEPEIAVPVEPQLVLVRPPHTMQRPEPPATPPTKKKSRTPRPTSRLVEEIVRSATRIYGIDVGDFFTSSRVRDAVDSRVVAMAVLRTEGWSLPAIGRYLGRDHSTVLRALRRLDTEPLLHVYVRQVREQLYPALAQHSVAVVA